MGNYKLKIATAIATKLNLPLPPGAWVANSVLRRWNMGFEHFENHASSLSAFEKDLEKGGAKSLMSTPVFSGLVLACGMVVGAVGMLAVRRMRNCGSARAAAQ